ncbi:hypothetical protein F5878DRAFT_665175 [Lentinula raphanica]|uniref:Uncharacterized protein n=1 Tax=Lentinula raphanica TaxID=153919 RepID=A0AA38P0H6_9AGAR|nr:hypothetical protein F5878DRAFT_665175 [Lentinula raphanica]
MPASPPFRTRTSLDSTSPIARRVLSHPRNEVRQGNKLGRVSTLYNKDTGMLNSQLTDTQWAVNIGLEATQDHQALFMSTPVKTEAIPFHLPPPPLMEHAAQPGMVKKEETVSSCIHQLPRNPLLELPPIFHLPSTPVKAEALPFHIPSPPLMKRKLEAHTKASEVKKEIPLSPLAGLSSQQLPPMPLGSPYPTSSPTLNEVSVPSIVADLVLPKAESFKVHPSTDAGDSHHQMLLSSAERKVIEDIRALCNDFVLEAIDDMKGVEIDRDLLRLELAHRERYINVLRDLLADRGISPPPSPLMQSQKAHLHFAL